MNYVNVGLCPVRCGGCNKIVKLKKLHFILFKVQYKLNKNKIIKKGANKRHS